MFFAILLGIIILAGIIYLAVSRKSSFWIRIAALGALALMVITVAICLLHVFGVIGTGESAAQVMPDAAASGAPAEQGNALRQFLDRLGYHAGYKYADDQDNQDTDDRHDGKFPQHKAEQQSHIFRSLLDYVVHMDLERIFRGQDFVFGDDYPYGPICDREGGIH